ncbi:N-acetyltransferase [Priestia flexa]|nr:N-acetyltransferase [Priestia flexa]MBN8435078.1 N-acetyltransferase [Priestia flexa]MCA0967419.1 N-acetyltransferase [Priestia flexa]UIR32197.1 N-acetyltransferase [Priestia flexa]
MELAFQDEKFSDQTEHRLVHCLRESTEWIEELSLVYELHGEIVGHVLLTKAYIGTERAETLALAPVSVLPAHQKKGIGTQLINKSLDVAARLRFGSVIVLGHQAYYPKFGFVKASAHGIKAPFEIADELFMVKELRPHDLDHVSGVVEYSSCFGG